MKASAVVRDHEIQTVQGNAWYVITIIVLVDRDVMLKQSSQKKNSTLVQCTLVCALSQWGEDNF